MKDVVPMALFVLVSVKSRMYPYQLLAGIRLVSVLADEDDVDDHRLHFTLVLYSLSNCRWKSPGRLLLCSIF